MNNESFMVYSLTSENLVDYLYERLSDPKYHYHLDVELSKDGKSVILRCHGKNFYLNPTAEKTKVQLELESPYIDLDIKKFLEELVNQDIIFMHGNPLYNEKRQKELPSWKKVLRRVPENGLEGKMSCEIVDYRVSTKRLKKIVYEYMVKPFLYCITSRKK